MKKTFAVLFALVFVFMLCACTQSPAVKNPKKALIGIWECKTNVLGVASVTVSYTFYEDGTCVQSTDLGQTSKWAFTDDTHVKVTTPLNFTETYEIKYEDGHWHLRDNNSDYVKVGD